MAKPTPEDVRIGKFDILVTYAYAQALADGMADADVKIPSTWGAKITGEQFLERARKMGQS